MKKSEGLHLTQVINYHHQTRDKLPSCASQCDALRRTVSQQSGIPTQGWQPLGPSTVPCWLLGSPLCENTIVGNQQDLSSNLLYEPNYDDVY